MERIKSFYDTAYDMLCGKHPYIRPLHFQWLAAKDLYKDLQRLLPNIEGRVLDVGCGDKPYETWTIAEKVEYLGIDVYPGPKVDIVIEPGRAWPIETESFDVVLCTQVMEHVIDLEKSLKEIRRVLKAGGKIIITVPFIYNEHGVPIENDYRRFSIHGLRDIFSHQYDISELKVQGGVGSTIGTLWLNWLSIFRPFRLLKAVLPLWIMFSVLVNGLGWLLDKIDKTQAFYGNVLIVATKR